MKQSPFIRQIFVVEDRIEDPSAFPFTLPAVKQLDGLELAPVTYFVGETGSGKSTILEAIAVAAGYNAEGGSKNFRFTTRPSESNLHRALRLSRSGREKTGFFLRAESFFNVATQVDELGVDRSCGGKSLHEQSHGESFLSLVKHRFGPDGLYILDEPEAALSPSRQLALVRRMHDLVEDGSQLIVATHAPIVMAYPGATIYLLDGRGITMVAYEETEHVSLTKDFLSNRERYLARLFSED